MMEINHAQINTALRYASGYLASGATVLILFGILPADTVHAIVDQSQKVLGDLKQTIGDSYVLVGLVAPVVATYIAKKGWNKSSDKSQVATVEAIPTAHVITTDPKLVSPGVKLVDTLTPHL